MCTVFEERFTAKLRFAGGGLRFPTSAIKILPYPGMGLAYPRMSPALACGLNDIVAAFRRGNNIITGQGLTTFFFDFARDRSRSRPAAGFYI